MVFAVGCGRRLDVVVKDDFCVPEHLVDDDLREDLFRPCRPHARLTHCDASLFRPATPNRYNHYVVHFLPANLFDGKVLFIIIRQAFLTDFAKSNCGMAA